MLNIIKHDKNKNTIAKLYLHHVIIITVLGPKDIYSRTLLMTLPGRECLCNCS